MMPRNGCEFKHLPGIRCVRELKKVLDGDAEVRGPVCRPIF